MTDEDRRISAGRAVVGKVIAEEVAQGNKGLRELVEPLMDPGEMTNATLPDGTPIGTVRRKKPAKSVSVNPTELLAWVRKNRPDQIEERVAPAYAAYLAAMCKRLGDAVDETTGEIIPGVELREGSSAYLVEPSDEGRAYILQKLAELRDIGILDLPAGTTE